MTTVAAQCRCHLCDANAIVRVPGYEDLLQVTSDCKPWRQGNPLVVCRICGGVQKRIDERWEDQIEQIYDDYEIYHQSEGVEQAVFDQASGAAATRTSRLLAEVCRNISISQKGRLLDIGCGNGALLRAFSKCRTDWSLVGTELGDKYRETVVAIPGVEGFHNGVPEEVPGQFDLITMIHVLEHIPRPRRFLDRVREKLKPGGRLLIQVPDHRQNPFDLLVADHATHFTIDSLMLLVRRAGFEPLAHSTQWIAKEITLVAQSIERACRFVPGDRDAIGPVQEAVRWLSSQTSWVSRLIGSDRIGLFGTSIAATWFAASRDDRVAFYVDEDPSRVGKTHRGCPVYHPDDVPSGSQVVVMLPPVLAARVAQRLARPHVRYHVPRAFLKNRIEPVSSST